jgi:hypothetical protein
MLSVLLSGVTPVRLSATSLSWQSADGCQMNGSWADR